MSLFSLLDEFNIEEGNLLTTIPVLGKEWRISHDFKPTSYTSGGPANSLHLTDGLNDKSYGDRIPAIFFSEDEGMYVGSAINQDWNFGYQHDNPPIDKWTNIVLSQKLHGGIYIYRIEMDGMEIFAVENSNPEQFYNVKVYASKGQAQAGSIRNITLHSTTEGKKAMINFNFMLTHLCFMLSILESNIGCQNRTTKGSDYNGTASRLSCKPWSSTAYADLGDHSYCRNPDYDSGVWCYTEPNLEGIDFEYCNVPVCQG